MILGSLGVDPLILCEAMGIAPTAEPLGDWVPYEVAVRLWEAAMSHSADPMLGVSVGERLPLGALGLVFHTANASDELGSALRRLTRYFGLASTVIEPSLQVEGQDARLVINVPARVNPRPPTALMESILTVFCRMLLSFSGGAAVPNEIRVAHKNTAAAGDYQARLGAPVSFSAGVYEILLPASALSRPVPTADPATLTALLRAIEGVAPPQTLYADRVRQALTPFVEQGTATIDVVARALGHKPRSLQRWLLAEGTSFGSLLEKVRRERALASIALPQLSLVEVAFFAGFAEPSAFFRAFRRWTGKTPTSYRRDMGIKSRG
jgi:AraC-like DNA-binding protein